jgi:hypothetical protein
MRAILPLLFLSWLAMPAAALEETEKGDIRAVIQRQLDAFRQDDGAAAYAQAAPNIRTQFPDESAFMKMVKQGYLPVYRPRNFDFGEVKEADESVLQMLRIEDQKGTPWTAVYALQKQPDGTWKISGCWLYKAPAVGT